MNDNDKLLTESCPHKDPDSDGYCHNCEGTMTVLTPLGSEVAAMIRKMLDQRSEQQAQRLEQVADGLNMKIDRTAETLGRRVDRLE